MEERLLDRTWKEPMNLVSSSEMSDSLLKTARMWREAIDPGGTKYHTLERTSCPGGTKWQRQQTAMLVNTVCIEDTEVHYNRFYR